MEDSSQEDYNASALACSANADAASKQLFESLVLDEERHFDVYENEMEKFQKYGSSYIALQSFGGGGGAAGAPGGTTPPA